MGKRKIPPQQEQRSSRFKILRMLNGHTMASLAQALGLTPGSLSSFEMGVITRDGELIKRICKLLQVPISTYVYGSQENLGGTLWRPTPPKRGSHLAKYYDDFVDHYVEIALLTGNAHLNFVWFFQDGGRGFWLGDDSGKIANLLLAPAGLAERIDELYRTKEGLSVHGSIPSVFVENPEKGAHFEILPINLPDIQGSKVYDDFCIDDRFGDINLSFSREACLKISSALEKKDLEYRNHSPLCRFIETVLSDYDNCSYPLSPKFDDSRRKIVVDLILKSLVELENNPNPESDLIDKMNMKIKDALYSCDVNDFFS